ncbi:hypothetical protein MBANPS3_010889 [Mucor bainieri]
MTMQAVTIGILNKALLTGIKSNVVIANMIHSIVPRLYTNRSNDDRIEDSLVHKLVSYAIKSTFAGADLLGAQWANGGLQKESAADVLKFKPDFVSYYHQRNNRFDLVVVEIKPRSNLSSSPPSDFVKLGQQMKIMINRLVAHHIPNPVVGSLLVEGNMCYTYQMELKGKNFYTMLLLDEFPLCTMTAELPLLPTIYQNINKLKSTAESVASRIEQTELAKGKAKRKASVSPLPTSWIHEGTCSYRKQQEPNKKQKTSVRQ